MIWVAVVGCGLGCYLLKLAGLSVPSRVLENPLVERVADLLPVALLAGLIAVQVFSATGPEGPHLQVDARLAGLGVALLLLLVRAPFLIVVIGAASTAALIRLF
ncbi:Branched-chain amino acid transport protein (AzlD) [metagenome]|uniref:Branched-chain amino acid transport protein (AzlD) n=1 Tax=metagenome TaxID=256318 RepID=A0A2P2BZM9_9ZZZZ